LTVDESTRNDRIGWDKTQKEVCMSLSRREFVRTLGIGGAGVLSADSVIGRGYEHVMAMGLQDRQERRAPRGADAIVVSSNENPRGPAESVLDVLRGRANYRVGRYPDNIGALEDTIAKKYGAKPENVLISTGSGPILQAAVMAFASRSKPLINGSPSYSSPDRTANQIKAPIKLVPVEKSSLSLDLGAMADASKGAGLVFVCNPNNPTSTVLAPATIAEFIKKVRATSPGTAIHVDEAYLDYAADPDGTAAPLALEYPDVFITRTFSKAYGMAGLRLGYAFGQAATLRKLSNAWGLGSVNVLTAAAGVAALKDVAHMAAERIENKRVRDYTLAGFKEMGYIGAASNANFIFLNLGRPAAEFRDACAKRSVFVARDFPPMEKTHARITIGTMDEMKKAMQVFRDVLTVSTTAAAGR
jgi:histidinol-phosphate aminotransferase